MKQLAGTARSLGMRVLSTTGVLLLGLLAGEASGTVQPTGSMSVTRWGHTATFVGTGRVLVAGGYGLSERLATAELFDPSTGLFSPTGSMPEARNAHTATVLRTGKVLVVGGGGASGTLATCALYDPRTGAWTPTGSLGTPRSNHTATLLANGMVLVVGGQNGMLGLSSAEFYDPASETWIAAFSLPAMRFGHSAVLLPDGKVLVAGGQSKVIPAEYTRSATIYDPATGEWTATGSMATARYDFTLTVLPTGLVVAAGGRNTDRVSTAERYNISTGGWGGAGDLGEGRSGHAAVLLPDARILVAGGSGTGGAVASMAEYDPVGNSWSVVETGTPRYSHAATLLPGGRVLVVGGLADGTTRLATAELVDRMNPDWDTVGTIWGRQRGTATLLPNGKVLVLGEASAGDATHGALFNPGTDNWAYTAGAMVHPRWGHTATLLADGRVLIVGGRMDGAYLDSDEIYDPVSDSFTAIQPMPSEDRRYGHHAVLLPDGRVLVAGSDGASNPFNPMLRDPATGTWSYAAGAVVVGGTRVTSLNLLPNGRVLVVLSGSFESYAYIFDPGAGDTWRPTTTLSGPGLYEGEGILLPGGDVLFVRQGLIRLVLFDVETEDFSWPFQRDDIPDWRRPGSATVLADGRVLLAGGEDLSNAHTAVPYAAVFDPATGVTAALPSMAEARVEFATVVLRDGRVLVSGGTAVTSAEVLDLWPDVVESWKPLISNWPSSLALPGAFTLMGTGFRGGAEASGGNGALNSSADAPSVLLRRVEGGLARWVPSSSVSEWSSTRFPSAAVAGLPGGTYRATLFASGRSSISRAFPVTACELTTGVLESTSAASVCQGHLLSLSARAINSATYLWTLPDGSTSTNRVLTIPDAQLDDGGFYTVVATKNGCTSPPDTVSIRVAAVAEVPVIEAESPIGVNADRVASVELHAGSTYAWTLSSGTIYWGQGTNEIGFRAPSTGTSMTITVVETVGATCVQPAAQKTITLIQCTGVPTPTASNTGPYCTGATISLSTPEYPGATYSWTGPNGFTSSLRNPTIVNARVFDEGTYTVNLIVGDCTSAPGETTVVVNPLPVAPVITAPASVAPGEHFVASVPDVAGATWNWVVSNGTLLGGGLTRQVTVVAGSTGAVTVTVTETHGGTGCGPQDASVAIPVALPLATRFYPVTPCRLFDTRNSGGADAAAPALEAGATRTFTIGTRCGLSSSTVRSLSVNQTVATPTADGELVVYRGDLAAAPTTSNISYRTGKTRANNGLLELSRAGDGTIKVTNRSAGSVDFILDVNGVFQ